MMRTKAFTIVELLIVIVVIAILAAISVVVYNGIQTRANNTQIVDAVKQFVKAYGLYALDNGNYPQVTGCLGEGYPSPNNRCLAQSGTAECFGNGGGSGAAVSTALRPYMNNTVPSPSMQQAACGNTTYIGAYASYQSASQTIYLIMILKGDQTCPPMSPNTSSPNKAYTGDATRCHYTLQAVT